MRPSEIELCWKFRKTVLELYKNVGAQSRDKIYLAYEVRDVLKELLEYYDSLFSDILEEKDE